MRYNLLGMTDTAQYRSIMKIHIKNNSAFPNRIFAIGRGESGVETLEFVFSREWNALSKKILFVSPSGSKFSVDYDGSPVNIPEEILNSRGASLIYAMGEGKNRLRSTLPIELVVVGSFPTETENEV